jgi:hypothetical protein
MEEVGVLVFFPIVFPDQMAEGQEKTIAYMVDSTNKVSKSVGSKCKVDKIVIQERKRSKSISKLSKL